MRNLCALFFISIGADAYATSFGLMATARLGVVHNVPAICLPEGAEKFSVGWMSLSQSYMPKPGSWGFTLKAGFKPLRLKSGECLEFGVVPEGYELDDALVRSKPLTLEADRVYIFRLVDFYEPRDTYTVAFCLVRKKDGSFEYVERARQRTGDNFCLKSGVR